jgi:hypothetical protein
LNKGHNGRRNLKNSGEVSKNWEAFEKLGKNLKNPRRI